MEYQPRMYAFLIINILVNMPPIYSKMAHRELLIKFYFSTMNENLPIQIVI
jgi:hypothetical protein